ncbi:MAG: prolipoprotein diacylglyceryl transferase [Thermodesulfobacteriota bacterium]
MFPILIKIGPFTLYTYGLMIAIGILVAVMVARSEARRKSMDPDKIADLAFYLVIAGVVGARLFYVATNPRLFMADPLEVFRIWNGGLVFYGAFITALIVCLVYLKKNRMPVWKVTDIFAPAVAIAHVFGRLGCFCAGCCYGKVCSLPWAVTFSNPDTLARPIGVGLHPTQLYDAINNLVIFSLLWLFRRRMKFDGQLFWIYILLYGVNRSVIETFRGDFRGEFIWGVFSISQVIGSSLALLAMIMLYRLYRRHAAS